MLPQTTVVANLVADCELRFSAAGKAVCKFRVAANDRRRDDAGNWVDGATTFLDCTAFGARAEACAEVLVRGTKVILTGRLQMREWADKDSGAKRSAYEVLVDEVGLLVALKPAARTAAAASADPWATVPAPSNYLPQNEEPPF